MAEGGLCEKRMRGGLAMTEKQTTELLPCPFCGGEAVTVLRYGYWFATCHDCCARTGSYRDKGAATEAWNTRAERTCDIECFDDGVDEGLDGEWFSYSPPMWYLSCGHTAQGTEKPNYCQNCGAKVVGE